MRISDEIQRIISNSINNESRLQSAKLRQVNPPKLSGENSHIVCHRERVAPGRTNPTSSAFAAMPTITTQQNAMKNSAAETAWLAIIWACAIGLENKRTTKTKMTWKTGFVLCMELPGRATYTSAARRGL